MNELHLRRCVPGAPALPPGRALALHLEVPRWLLAADESALTRTFDFPDFHAVMAFVNAVAWIAHQEDHHPDLTVGYSRVTVRWSTHDVGGLTENDFLCAAKVDALIAD